MPPLFELSEQRVGATQGVRVAGNALGAAVLAFGDQLRTLQNGDVLLHGCERHFVARGQVADRRVGGQYASQNVAPCGIGQRPEEAIEVFGRRLPICNHMVVDTSTPAGAGNGARTRVRRGPGGSAGEGVILW